MSDMVLIKIYFGFKFFYVRKVHYPKPLQNIFLLFKIVIF